MKKFSTVEMQHHINYHKQAADKCLELFNSDINMVACIIAMPGEHGDSPLSAKKISLETPSQIEMFKSLLQNLCQYHVRQRITWEISLQKQTNEPTV